MKPRRAARRNTPYDYRSRSGDHLASEGSALTLTAGPARIFISYRRTDASWPVRWLAEWLTGQFGPGVVFLDADSIRPGDDFAAKIEGAVRACSVLLVVIGPHWLAAKGSVGRRVDDPRDWVRLEIEIAIERGVCVIPVLVNGARMPSHCELPSSLLALADRHAVELNPACPDTRRLASVLEAALAPEGSRILPASGHEKMALAQLS